MSDAYWTYRATEYIRPGPPLETSLFDNPQRLQESWDRALETMRAQAALPAEVQEECCREAEELTASWRAADTTEAGTEGSGPR